MPIQNAKGEMQKAAHAIPISFGATANADYSTGNGMRQAAGGAPDERR
jgi:hypothetical protein